MCYGTRDIFLVFTDVPQRSCGNDQMPCQDWTDFGTAILWPESLAHRRGLLLCTLGLLRTRFSGGNSLKSGSGVGAPVPIRAPPRERLHVNARRVVQRGCHDAVLYPRYGPLAFCIRHYSTGGLSCGLPHCVQILHLCALCVPNIRQLRWRSPLGPPCLLPLNVPQALPSDLRLGRKASPGREVSQGEVGEILICLMTSQGCDRPISTRGKGGGGRFG